MFYNVRFIKERYRMPPKPKYTREEIVNAAFEMTREGGIQSVVARELGKKLGNARRFAI